MVNLSFFLPMTHFFTHIRTYLLALAASAMAFVSLTPAVYAVVDIEPLRISNVEISTTDTSATITWLTNRDATGRIDYGTSAGSYAYHIETNLKDERQTISLLGLRPEEVYYFIITARDDFTEVVSFERGFETKELDDNQPPDISDVRVRYITGTTATIQWRTDEPSSSYVEYGKKSTLGSSAGNNTRTLVHDVTIKNLTIGALYHFRVKSQDEQRNIAVNEIDTFRTLITDESDKDTLIVYGAEPTPENNVNVTQTTAVIKFRTNKLAEAWIDYGIDKKYLKTIKLSEPRTFLHTYTLTNLNPGQTYYYDITVRDVFGKKIESEGYSFTTQAIERTPDNRKPRVLGISTCSANYTGNTGFYGMYYNLPESHRDMEFTKKGRSGKISTDAKGTDWYNDEYFAFDRIDNSLQFGDKFFPVPSELPGDPFHFTVHWRALMDAPTDSSYTYDFTVNNDLWVYIDGNLVIDSNNANTGSGKGTLYIEAGYHEIDIYFAERHSPTSIMTFIPDSRLQFSPLPADCSIDEVLLSKNANPTNGVVLGASNDTTHYVQPAVCNPNLGYTRITALYKSNQSPDVWAILETGQKHYITSPEAFNRYECDWSRITTVSQSKLDSIPNATLVRSPQAETVYYLYQRPQHQWLRINIPSPTVFVSYPNNYWGNIAYVDALDIMSYQNAKLVTTKSSSAIYLVQDQTKHLIPDEDTFNRYGFTWPEVVEISQEHLNSYLRGNPLN